VERLKNNHPMKNPEIARKVSEKLKGIKRPYQAGDKSVFKRPEIREQAKIAREKKGWIGGEKHPWWKGGVKAKNLPRYDTYADRLIVADEVRREPQNQNILQVKCKFCNSWYTPKASQVENRIKAINGKSTGEQNFYCSNECRLSCSIFQQKKYPKYNKPYIARKDQKELRKLVLDRDGYQCQICGEKNQDLICHHINPVSKEPIESADLDNCVTLCKECEKKVHKLPGCNFHELKKCY
jgi:5-methylcytosine-specific restriction endonuclease McrA